MRPSFLTADTQLCQRVYDTGRGVFTVLDWRLCLVTVIFIF